MQDARRLSADDRRTLLQLINSQATPDDRDVGEVVADSFHGDFDEYLRVMARYLGLGGCGRTSQP